MLAAKHRCILFLTTNNRSSCAEIKDFYEPKLTDSILDAHCMFIPPCSRLSKDETVNYCLTKI